MKARLQVLTRCLLLLLLSACSLSGTQAELQQLVILNGDQERARYQVEVAGSETARRRGLMHRQHMPADHGMLLDYPSPALMAIWMKNTYLSLDIIFIDDAGRIVRIHENAEPLSTRRIESQTPVRAVLEVNAGQVAGMGIRVGDRVRHTSFDE